MAGFIYFATYNYYVAAFLPHLPHVGTCSGREFAAFTGCAILTSYLFLFLAFYAATYKKSSSRQKKSLSAVATDLPRTAAVDLQRTTVPTMAETSGAATEALHVVEGAVKAAGSQIAQEIHLTAGSRH